MKRLFGKKKNKPTDAPAETPGGGLRPASPWAAAEAINNALTPDHSRENTRRNLFRQEQERAQKEKKEKRPREHKPMPRVLRRALAGTALGLVLLLLAGAGLTAFYLSRIYTLPKYETVTSVALFQGTEDGNVRVRVTVSGEVVYEYLTSVALNGSFQAAALEPSSAVWRDDETAGIIAVRHGEGRRITPDDASGIRTLKISADGSAAVWYVADGSLLFADLDQPEEYCAPLTVARAEELGFTAAADVVPVPALGDEFAALSFAAAMDGSAVAYTDREGKLYLWHADSGDTSAIGTGLVPLLVSPGARYVWCRRAKEGALAVLTLSAGTVRGCRDLPVTVSPSGPMRPLYFDSEAEEVLYCAENRTEVRCYSARKEQDRILYPGPGTADPGDKDKEKTYRNTVSPSAADGQTFSAEPVWADQEYLDFRSSSASPVRVLPFSDLRSVVWRLTVTTVTSLSGGPRMPTDVRIRLTDSLFRLSPRYAPVSFAEEVDGDSVRVSGDGRKIFYYRDNEIKMKGTRWYSKEKTAYIDSPDVHLQLSAIRPDADGGHLYLHSMEGELLCADTARPGEAPVFLCRGCLQFGTGSAQGLPPFALCGPEGELPHLWVFTDAADRSAFTDLGPALSVTARKDHMYYLTQEPIEWELDKSVFGRDTMTVNATRAWLSPDGVSFRDMGLVSRGRIGFFSSSGSVSCSQGALPLILW